jgi:hypothetical protein
MPLADPATPPPRPTPRRRVGPVSFWKILVGLFALFVVAFIGKLVTSSSSGNSGSSPVQSASGISADSPSDEAEPASERDFISAVASFEQRYANAANEFQKSAVRHQRAASIAAILPGQRSRTGSGASQ